MISAIEARGDIIGGKQIDTGELICYCFGTKRRKLYQHRNINTSSCKFHRDAQNQEIYCFQFLLNAVTVFIHAQLLLLY